MSIKNSLIFLLLLMSSVQAGVNISVTSETWVDTVGDSSAHLAIPRHQVGLTGTAGEIVLTGDGFPHDRVQLVYIPDFTANPIAPVYYQLASGSVYPDDHAHLFMKGDTAYVSWIDSGTVNIMTAYRCDGGTITKLFSHIWEYTAESQSYVSPVCQVGTTDTMLSVTRTSGSSAPDPENLEYYLSDDNGQTWTNMGYALDWSGVSARIRIGLERYDGSVMLVADSADQKTILAYWNRATAAWVHFGAATTIASEGYRAFGAGVYNGDTSIVGWMIKDNSGAGYNDTCYSGYRNKGAVAWTAAEKFLMSTGNNGSVPYTCNSYIESSKRQVLFYTKNNSTDVNNFTVHCRYWMNDSLKWSPEFDVDTRTPRGGNSYKLSAPAIVPSALGDKTYVSFGDDSTSGATRYQLGVISQVEFVELADTITIATLPYTLAQDSTVYIFGEDVLTSNTYGLTMTTGLNNVIVDGQGDTIKFGQTGTYADTTNDWGSQDNWGVWMRNLAGYDITFRNIVFMFDPPGWKVEDSTYPLYGGCIRMGAAIVNLRLENCRFLVKGRNSKIMWGDWSGNSNYNIELINCTFVDSMDAYYRRDQWAQQSMINFQGINQASSETFYGIPFEYHLKMEYCTTEVAYWNNLHLEGDSTVAIIHDNIFKTDGRNRLIGTTYAQGIYTTAAENYCVAFRQGENAIADGVRIKFYNNRLLSDSVHYGGRGIFISGVEGINWNFDDSCLAIYDNYIYARQGFDGYTQTNNGIIAREDWSGLRIYNNEIWVPVFTTPPDSAAGYGPAAGMRVTSNFGGNLYFKHNTIYAFFADSNSFDPATDGKAAYCVLFEENEQNTSNLLIDSNHFFSNNAFVRWGFFNGQGGNPQMLGNRYSYYAGTSPGGSKRWTAYLGYGASNTHHSYPNYYIDPIFDSAVADTHIYVDQTEPDSLSMGLKYTITVTVVDTLANPIVDAIVTFTNNYTNLVATDTTDNNGLATGLVKTWEEFSSVYSNPDSSSFNPFTISVTKGADNADTTITVAWNAKTVTVELGATSGEPVATAPAFLMKDYFIIKDRVRIGRQTTSGSGVEQGGPEP